MAPARAPRLLIVGGVAGGMSAATRARRLCEDTEIIVFESGQYVSYANCGIPYALGGVIKDDRNLVLQTPQSFKERYNIDVHLGSEVIAIARERKEISVRHAHDGSIASYYYDHLILAQGAEATRLPIPGKDLPPVFTLQTIDDLEHITNFIHMNECERAVVIGGGFIGLEAAENIHKLGLDVTVVEYLPHVMPIADPEIAEPLHDELRKHGLRLLLNAKVERIRTVDTKRATSVSSLMVDTSQGDSVPADIVLMCVGLKARTSLASAAGLGLGNTGVSVNEFMQTSDPAIYAVGDMAETQNIISFDWSTLMLAGPANRQGRCAANHIMKKEHRYRGNVGTSICKVFDLTIATTGVSVQALRRLKRPVQWVTVHPPDHATYYPDATAITMKVAFDPDDGHLLGAQAVGQKGVDKRIDVISTALLANMTIHDLEHVELAYAPPYGAAKDPINMAGFVGGNVLRGDVVIIHAEDVADRQGVWQILDVRTRKEFERGHLQGAINIPLTELRENAISLDKNRNVLVYCQVGFRGYLAYRVLKQMGFNVANLDGGYKTYTCFTRKYGEPNGVTTREPCT